MDEALYADIVDHAGLDRSLEQAYADYQAKDKKWRSLRWKFLRWRKKRAIINLTTKKESNLYKNTPPPKGEFVFLIITWSIATALWSAIFFVKWSPLDKAPFYAFLALGHLAALGIATDIYRGKMRHLGHILVTPLMPLWYLFDLVIVWPRWMHPYMQPRQSKLPMHEAVPYEYAERLMETKEAYTGEQSSMCMTLTRLHKWNEMEQERKKRLGEHADGAYKRNQAQRTLKAIQGLEDLARERAERIDGAIKFTREALTNTQTVFNSLEQEIKNGFSDRILIEQERRLLEVEGTSQPRASLLEPLPTDPYLENIKEVLRKIGEVLLEIPNMPSALGELDEYTEKIRSVAHRLTSTYRAA